MTETALDPNAELLELANSPTTPTWLARLIPSLLDKDPVDLANTFTTVAGVLERRLTLFIEIAQADLAPGDSHEDNPQGGYPAVAPLAEAAKEAVEQAMETGLLQWVVTYTGPLGTKRTVKIRAKDADEAVLVVPSAFRDSAEATPL